MHSLDVLHSQKQQALSLLVTTCHYCGALAAGLCQSASIDFQQGQRLEVGSQPGGVLSTRAGHNCKIATSADLGHEVKTSDDDSEAAAKRCCTSLPPLLQLSRGRVWRVLWALCRETTAATAVPSLHRSFPGTLHDV